MSREVLSGGPSPASGGDGRPGRLDADHSVLDLSAHQDEPEDVGRRTPSRRRLVVAVVAVCVAVPVVWTTAARGSHPDAPAAARPAGAARGTGWFAGAPDGGGVPGGGVPDGGVPDGLVRRDRPRFAGPFPATPKLPATVYRLSASQNPQAPNDLIGQTLAATVHLPAGAEISVSTDPARGLDTWEIADHSGRPPTPGPLRVPAGAAVDLARQVLTAVGADPTQWRVTTSGRAGDGWRLALTLVFPGLERLQAQPVPAGLLPHGTMTVTTAATGAGRLVVPAMTLTSGYRAGLDAVDVRPAEEAFTDVAAGRFQVLDAQSLSSLATRYQHAEASLAVVPEPTVALPHPADPVHPTHLLVPAWSFTTGDGQPPLLVSAVPPDVLLAGVRVGDPYAANPGP